IGARPHKEVALEVLRNGKPRTLTVVPESTPNSRFDIGQIGVLPDVHPYVPSVIQGDPAERAGVKPGDVILAVDGEPITFSGQLAEAIAKKPNQPLKLSILRDRHRLTIEVTSTKHGSNGWIGINIHEATKTIKPGPLEAVGMSIHKNIQFAELI